MDAVTAQPPPPSAATLEALHLSVWGGRRYAMLVQLEADRMREWAECMEQLCLRTLESNQGRSTN